MPGARKPEHDRHERFAIEYCIDRNATRAAIAAGYAKRGAHVTGSRLLRHPKVAALIESIQARALKTAEITIERTLKEIARIAYSDVRDLYGENGQLLPVKELSEAAAAQIAGVESEDLYETDAEGNRTVIGVARKVKRFDKGRALEQCMAFLGMHKTNKTAEGGSLAISIYPSTAKGRK